MQDCIADAINLGNLARAALRRGVIVAAGETVGSEFHDERRISEMLRLKGLFVQVRKIIVVKLPDYLFAIRPRARALDRSTAAESAYTIFEVT